MHVSLLPLVAMVAWAGVPTKSPPDPERGRQLYGVNCWQCHGKAALGDGPAQVALRAAAPALAGRLGDSPLPPQVDLILTGSGDMPGFGAVMDRRDARRILKWLAGLDPETGKDPMRPKLADKKDAKKGDKKDAAKKKGAATKRRGPAMNGGAAEKDDAREEAGPPKDAPEVAPEVAPDDGPKK